jgi:hypothetical protein
MLSYKRLMRESNSRNLIVLVPIKDSTTELMRQTGNFCGLANSHQPIFAFEFQYHTRQPDTGKGLHIWRLPFNRCAYITTPVSAGPKTGFEPVTSDSQSGVLPVTPLREQPRWDSNPQPPPSKGGALSS